MSTQPSVVVRSVHAQAIAAREPFVYLHIRTGTVLRRRDVLAVLGGVYTDGSSVRAADFQPILPEVGR